MNRINWFQFQFRWLGKYTCKRWKQKTSKRWKQKSFFHDTKKQGRLINTNVISYSSPTLIFLYFFPFSIFLCFLIVLSFSYGKEIGYIIMIRWINQTMCRIIIKLIKLEREREKSEREEREEEERRRRKRKHVPARDPVHPILIAIFSLMNLKLMKKNNPLVYKMFGSSLSFSLIFGSVSLDCFSLSLSRLPFLFLFWLHHFSIRLRLILMRF